MKNRSAYFKVYLTFIVLFALITAVILYVVETSTNSMISGLTTQQAQTATRALENYLAELSATALQRAEIIAGSETFTDAVGRRDFDMISTILYDLSYDFDFATICDLNGTVLARIHSDSLEGDLSGRPEVSDILEGKPGKGRIDLVPTLGFVAIHASAPIYSNGEIAGVVIGGFDLSSPKLLQNFKARNGSEASLFYGTLRINSTVTDEKNNSIVGKTLDDEIVRTVTENGEFLQKAKLFGTMFLAHYSPFYLDGEQVGMLFTGVDIGQATRTQQLMQFIVAMMAALAVCTGCAFLYSVAKYSQRISREMDALSIKVGSLGVLEKVLDSLDIYLYVTDPATGKVLYTNKALMDHLNLTRSVIGEYCWKVFQQNMDDRCDFCPINELKRHPPGEIYKWDAVNTITNLHYRNTDRLIDWPGGQQVQFCQRIDITETKLALERAERASRAKSEFLSRMSHEMRTPLNAITGMTRIAQKAKQFEDVSKCLQKISDSSEHLLGVINDILDMSKIEAGKMELEYSDFRIEQLLAQVSAVMDIRLSEKEQSFNVRILPGVPEAIVSDRQRLAQVIINLVGNANKFTPKGGTIDLTIEKIEAEGAADKLQFEIRDNGVGIDPAAREQLFAAFEQGDNSISRKFGGTGLGLSISKRIVTMLGGEIWASSLSGGGSAFCFTLALMQGISSDGEPGVDLSGIETENLFSGKRILLADDVEINREIVVSMLEDSGAVFDCAENGEEALRKFSQNPEGYDLILMDIHMPVMSGLDAAAEIRKLPGKRAAAIPIIAMTADVLNQDVERCLAFGMNGHVGKPLNFDNVLEILCKFLLNKND